MGERGREISSILFILFKYISNESRNEQFNRRELQKQSADNDRRGRPNNNNNNKNAIKWLMAIDTSVRNSLAAISYQHVSTWKLFQVTRDWESNGKKPQRNTSKLFLLNIGCEYWRKFYNMFMLLSIVPSDEMGKLKAPWNRRPKPRLEAQKKSNNEKHPQKKKTGEVKASSNNLDRCNLLSLIIFGGNWINCVFVGISWLPSSALAAFFALFSNGRNDLFSGIRLDFVVCK